MGLDLALSVALACFAWLINKTWEVSERRRLRYVGIVQKLSALYQHGTPAERRVFLDEVAALWIDAPKNVILKAEMFLDAVETASPESELLLKELIVELRQSAQVFEVKLPFRMDAIKPTDFRIRSPK